MFRFLAIIVSTFFLSACGTLITLVDSDERVSFGLTRSNCNEIPYVYSGVVYDFCILNGDAELDSEGAPVAGGPGPFIYVGIDFLFSGLFDTVALPYTLYRHSKGDYIIVGE